MQLPLSVIEPFGIPFPSAAESDPATISKIVEAINQCLRNSIQKNVAPQNYRKNKNPHSYSPSAMGWLLAYAARKAGAEIATYSLRWLRNESQILGVTYHINFTLPNSKRKYRWSVSQRFMIDRYTRIRWSTS